VASSLLVCALLAFSCSTPGDGPVAIQTYKPSGATCLLLPVYGVLVTDPTFGLALMGTDDSGDAHKYGVVWPDGYSARREQGSVLLLDSHGSVVARDGDEVVIDANAEKEPLYPCGDVEKVAGD